MHARNGGSGGVNVVPVRLECGLYDDDAAAETESTHDASEKKKDKKG